MKEITILEYAGSFAENKDTARTLRKEKIIPILQNGENVILNFSGVDAATQSFMHALLSDLFRNYGAVILDRVFFKNCNDTIKSIITIVAEYMQEAD